MIWDALVLRANVMVELRERGKLSQRYEAHNILVNLGRNWLISAIGEQDTGTYPVTHPVRYIRYMGFGIGGSKQTVDVASEYPTLNSAYPGSAIQDDTDPSVEHLERPIAIRTSGGSDVWLEEVNYTYDLSDKYAQFSVHFSENDINVVSSGSYPAVPISEMGLFLSDQSPSDNPYTNNGALRQALVFYIGFGAITKRNTMTMDVSWKIMA